MAAPDQAAHSQWPHGLAVSHITVAGYQGQLLHADDAVLEGTPRISPTHIDGGVWRVGASPGGAPCPVETGRRGKKAHTGFPSGKGKAGTGFQAESAEAEAGQL